MPSKQRSKKIFFVELQMYCIECWLRRFKRFNYRFHYTVVDQNNVDGIQGFDSPANVLKVSSTLYCIVMYLQVNNY